MASKFRSSARLFRKPQSTNVFSRSAGFFAPNRSVARFRCEEPLRQLFHAFVFLQVIFQFVLIRLSPADGKRSGLPEGSISPGFKNRLLPV
jgi:hypothetical protein